MLTFGIQPPKECTLKVVILLYCCLCCTLLNSQQWREVKPSGKKPVPRHYHSSCVISGNDTGDHPLLMVIGGLGGLGHIVLSDVWFLDVTNESWSEVYSIHVYYT